MKLKVVCISYNERQILNNINLTFDKQGDVVNSH